MSQEIHPGEISDDVRCTAFLGDRLVASGTRVEVALALKAAGLHQGVLVFDDATGRELDFDLRGTAAEVAARLAPPAEGPRGRGRPKLGVIGREVTLLPRHWDWLAAQAGGASVALRRLVDEARSRDADALATRQRRDAAWRFMSAMAGNRDGFEEAARALYAGDRAGLCRLVGAWPADIRAHVLRLAPED
ncbi:DUF2239 family protein [Zavarzinia sp. CC-PAN008]|uniref:DUF2239 family protein n=1 Tax=Zavarzinia sp. CC-PAN008 TaxID=3243332 RepID=UPI003F744489